MENILIILVSIIAGVSTCAIAISLKKGPVFASATVTLIAGIIFPYFSPEIGGKLMLAAACSSYAGMVSTENVHNFWEMTMVSAITGSLFIITQSAYAGVGGRLGTIAAVACFAWLGFKKTFRRVKQQYAEKN